MSFCYSNIIRVVWLHTGGHLDIDAPRIHFVTSRGRPPPVTVNGYGGAGFTAVRNSAAVATAHATSRHTTPTAAPAGGTDNTYRHDVTTPRSMHVSIPRKMAISSKRNVLKMTMSVIVGFVVCWTPYFVVSLVRIYSDYRIRIENALIVSEIMALVHSALNPLLYMLFSTRTVKSLCWQVRLPCSCRPQQRSPGIRRPSLDRSTAPECKNLAPACVNVPVTQTGGGRGPGGSAGSSTASNQRRCSNCLNVSVNSAAPLSGGGDGGEGSGTSSRHRRGVVMSPAGDHIGGGWSSPSGRRRTTSGSRSGR